MDASMESMPLTELLSVIKRYWGFDQLRPLQEQAMRAVLDGRDSVVVLPTGGGKSLCYQAPAVLRGDTTIIVSPLISLMKDQVDALRGCGIPAVQINSSLDADERFARYMDLRDGAIRLLFVSPERLVMPDFSRLLKEAKVRSFAIDEAHCISHWGHDFRPEYRQLGRLKELFPEASVHAYTATATERVRRDIALQLNLHNPEVLVGNFDRPNLSYRVLPRQDLLRQVRDVLDRHADEAGIIYCPRRVDVDELARTLQKLRYKAMPYHAGMTREQRQATQNAFSEEKCDIVVATVAFGMGIDRSNVRFVLHTAMPKSVEHFQQETGRAGRDGLEAECVLLFSGADTAMWRRLIEKSALEAGASDEFIEAANAHVSDMDRYARGAICRHRALVEYFGQGYTAPSCHACDICLGDTEPVPDAVVVAQKILSCVARVKERFGAAHIVAVLRGDNTEAIRRWKHNELSTYGLLNDCSAGEVRDWIQQLVGQQVLLQEQVQLEGRERSYPIMKLNAASWEVMKSQRQVRLIRLAQRGAGERPQKSQADLASWEGVDRELFESLRKLRIEVASATQRPAYLVFSDATLRELARVRPSSLEKMRRIYGIGEVKLREYGERFLNRIIDHSRIHALSLDNPLSPRSAPEVRVSSRLNGTREQCFDLFRQGQSLGMVAQETERAASTIIQYLEQYIREEKPSSIDAWVSPQMYVKVAQAAKTVGTDRLKPIFLELSEQVPYDVIRLVVEHLRR
jgi:ATP-dependent DNA helicase RecQ